MLHMRLAKEMERRPFDLRTKHYALGRSILESGHVSVSAPLSMNTPAEHKQEVLKKYYDNVLPNLPRPQRPVGEMEF
jgi:hypothetical protein